MFSQDEIDAVLANAQGAVDDLATDVEALNSKPATATIAAPSPAPAPIADTPTPQPAGQPRARVAQILALEVPLVVRLANRSMTIGEIMALSPGAILEFARTVDQELDLMINNCEIGSGVAVKVDEHFGLRITHIGGVRERIGSLGAA